MSSNNVFNNVIRNDFVKIKFNQRNKSIELNGVVKKIDKDTKKLYLLNYEIPFSDIEEIEKICN